MAEGGLEQTPAKKRIHVFRYMDCLPMHSSNGCYDSYFGNRYQIR